VAVREGIRKYLGAEDVPNRDRPLSLRISHPKFASSRGDVWLGLLVWTFAAIAAVGVLLIGRWYWYVIGAVDLVMAIPGITRSALALVRGPPPEDCR
jgi:hypothetical protein